MTLRKQGYHDKAVIESLFKKEWVVYAKQPFGHVYAVVKYLARYTHKIAISNARIQEVDKDNVTFKYKDYKQKGITKKMTLTHKKFVRRFAQHILPKGFTRIRHYGFLSSTCKRLHLKNVQAQLDYTALPNKNETMLNCCTICKSPTMVTLCTFDDRGPPKKYLLVTKATACKS